jgi:hypothetical protein
MRKKFWHMSTHHCGCNKIIPEENASNTSGSLSLRSSKKIPPSPLLSPRCYIATNKSFHSVNIKLSQYALQWTFSFGHAHQKTHMDKESHKVPLWGSSHHTIVWTLDRMPSHACHMLAFAPGESVLHPLQRYRREWGQCHPQTTMLLVHLLHLH